MTTPLETLSLHQTAIAVAACARAGHVPLIIGSPGVGKCLGPDVPVLRHDGRIVPASRVRAGDKLMGPDGQPRTVLSTVVGVGPMYQITPTKGDPWTCNDVHVLTIVNSVSDEVTDIPLDVYLAKAEHFKHHAKLFQPAGGVDFAFKEPPPVDPYFLGLWFGDGNKPGEDHDHNFTGLRSVAITTMDPEVLEAVEAVATQWGLTLTPHQKPGANCKTYRMTGGSANQGRGRSNSLLDTMRILVGPDAVIPHDVITGSRDVRAAFLAGFLDSDGHLRNNGYEFVQKRGDYADAVALIARSLGLRVTRTIKTVAGAMYHRLFIFGGDTVTLPLRIPRKIAAARQQVKDALRVGFTVEPLGEGEYAGFELDGDGRFLLGDFTVTHNTSLLRAIVGTVGKALGYNNPDNYQLSICILSNREAVDVGGYPVIKSDDTVELRLFGSLSEAAEHPRLLGLDEFLTCSQSVQGPALRLTLERVAGETPLHPDTRIVAAANPPDQAPGGIQLTAALVNRLVILHCEPRIKEISDYFCGRPEASLSIDLTLPDAATFNETKSRLMDTAGILFGERPDLLQLVPPPASISSGEPFASPRAWEICCGVLAALPPKHLSTVSDVTRALVFGILGPVSGIAYLSLLRARTHLPSVQEILDTPNTTRLPDPNAKVDVDGKAKEIGRDINFAAIPLVIEAARVDTFATWVYVKRLPPEIQAAVAKSLAATIRTPPNGSKWHVEGQQTMLAIVDQLASPVKKAS